MANQELRMKHTGSPMAYKYEKIINFSKNIYKTILSGISPNLKSHLGGAILDFDTMLERL